MFDEFAYLGPQEDPSAEEESEFEEAPPEYRKHFDNRDELCQYIRDISGPDVFCWFSGGKDSIACYLQLQKFFDRIHLCYGFGTWPIFDFIEDKLKEFEDRWQTKIWRVPYFFIFRGIVNDIYQPPSRRRVGERCFTNRDLWSDESLSIQEVKDWLDLPDAFHGIGFRSNDSFVRRSTISKNGSVYYDDRRFFPVFDMGKKELLDLIEEAGIKLPVDYRMFNRSWDGFDYLYITEIKEHFPKDYETILRNYPLAKAEIKRVEFEHARRISRR